MTLDSRRVLIVSPRFPPINAADHHRVRTSLPFYSRFGWKATVLALTPETCDGVMDPVLLETVPEEIEVIRVAAIAEEFTRRFGFGHVDLRGLFPMYFAGCRLLDSGAFDLVYFSTTAFSVFALARLWKRRFGCRIVFDFQDPWFREGPEIYDAATAPGGIRKYRLSQWMSRHLERFSMKAADRVISVSEAYVEALTNRYRWMSPSACSVIPFGAPARDFEVAERLGTGQTVYRKDDGLVHWVYVGRGGPDLVPALTAIFRSLAHLRNSEPDIFGRVRLHFVGTNYSPQERTFKVIQPEAERCGVGDIVDEHPGRVPYFEALALMRQSDALVVMGSKSSDYTASKFLTYVLARKPTLAVFNQRSLISDLARKVGWVRLAAFHRDPSEPETAEAVESGLRWLVSSPAVPDSAATGVEQYSAEALTRVQCDVFDRAVDG